MEPSFRACRIWHGDDERKRKNGCSGRRPSMSARIRLAPSLRPGLLFRCRQDDAGDDPPTSGLGGWVGEARLDDGGEIPEELGELGITEPQRCHAVAGTVSGWVGFASRQVPVGFGEEAGDEGHEGVPMVVWGHGGYLVRAELGGCGAEDVGAFDGTSDTLLGDDVEDTGFGEQADVAVQAADGNVVELGGELAGGERAVPEERLDDAQADRVQEQVGARHGRNSSHRSC